MGDFYIDHNTWTTYLPEELIDYFEEREQCERLLQTFREDLHRCMARLDELLRAIQQPHVTQTEAAQFQRETQLLEQTVELKNRSIRAIERKFEAWLQHDAIHQNERSTLCAKLSQERAQYEVLLAESQQMQREYEEYLAAKVSAWWVSTLQ